MAYNDEFLSLSRNAIYVGFYDPTNRIHMGKLINLARDGQSFKPDNAAAAMLLYLLNRTDRDPVHFNTLRDLVVKKTGFAAATAESKITAFLELLDNLQMLVAVPVENQSGTADPDPEKLFDPPNPAQPQTNWVWSDPTLTQSNPSRRRGDHIHYGHGYYLITIRR